MSHNVLLHRLSIRVNRNANEVITDIRATRRLLRQVEKAVMEGDIKYAASILPSVLPLVADLNHEIVTRALPQVTRVHVVDELPEEGQINGRVALTTKNLRPHSLPASRELTAEDFEQEAKVKADEKDPVKQLLRTFKAALSAV